jgi:hypothetical protein
MQAPGITTQGMTATAISSMSHGSIGYTNIVFCLVSIPPWNNTENASETSGSESARKLEGGMGRNNT